MLGLETAIFFVAALIHFEVLMDGYPDREAGIAEMVIGVVLLTGLIYTFLAPERTRATALIVQGFALAGTFVGLTLLLTIGPVTALDLAIHVLMVVVLVAGLSITWRDRSSFRPPSERVTDGSTSSTRR
jgi:hypothetical protein